MKKEWSGLLALLTVAASVSAQPLVLQGRVWCLNHQASNSTSGVENIIVIPGFLPQKSTLTGANPKGYYEINTGIPLKKLEGKTVKLYLVSRCSNCSKLTNAVFVSADQANRRGSPPGYLPVDAWKINAVCQEVELDPAGADVALQKVISQPADDLEKLTAASALVAPTSVLSLIAKLVTVAPVVNVGKFEAERFRDSGKIRLGQFLAASAMFQTLNQGFNFSPWRNLSEAVFYNPSALVNSAKPYHIGGFTNMKNLGKLSGYITLNDKLMVAAGGIYTRQDEFRTVEFKNLNETADNFVFKTKEYAAFLSPVYRLSNKLSLAVTAKFIGQQFNAPDTVDIQQDPNINIFMDQKVSRHVVDADLSFTYQALPSLQLGVNAMNLAGSKLYNRAFVANDPARSYNNQRALGAGLCYKYKRLNVGADVLFTGDEFFDAAFGINYIPLNNVLVSGGVAVKQGSYSLAVRLKNFRIGYLYDNNWLINEERPGKWIFTKGRVYSGFTFDF
jgi:hypothetical protein